MPVLYVNQSTPGAHVFAWVAVAVSIAIFLVFVLLLAPDLDSKPEWFLNRHLRVQTGKEPDRGKPKSKGCYPYWLFRLFRRGKQAILPLYSGPSKIDCSRGVTFVQGSLKVLTNKSALSLPAPVAFPSVDTIRLTSSFPPSRQQVVAYRSIAAPGSSPIPALFDTSDPEPLIKEPEDYASALPPPVVKPADLSDVDTAKAATDEKEPVVEISDLFGTSDLEPLIKELEDYASLVKALPVPFIQPPKPGSPATKPPEYKQKSPARAVVTTTTKATTKVLPQRCSAQKDAMKENKTEKESPSNRRPKIKDSGSVAKRASVHVPSTSSPALSPAVASRVPLASSTNSPSKRTTTVQTLRPSRLPISSPSTGSKAVAPSRLSVPRTRSKIAKSASKTAALDAVSVPFVHLAYQPRDRMPKWRPMEEVIVESAEELPVEELYPPLRRNFQFPSRPSIMEAKTKSTGEDEDLDTTPIRGYDWWQSQLGLQR